MNSPRYRPAGFGELAARVMLEAEVGRSRPHWTPGRSATSARLMPQIRRRPGELGVRAAIGPFEAGGVAVRPLPVRHTSHPTHGYLIETAHQRAAWAPEFWTFPEWAADVDLMFADAAGWDKPIRFAGGVGGHACVRDVAAVARSAGVRRWSLRTSAGRHSGNRPGRASTIRVVGQRRRRVQDPLSHPSRSRAAAGDIHQVRDGGIFTHDGVGHIGQFLVMTMGVRTQQFERLIDRDATTFSQNAFGLLDGQTVVERGLQLLCQQIAFASQPLFHYGARDIGEPRIVAVRIRAQPHQRFQGRDTELYRDHAGRLVDLGVPKHRAVAVGAVTVRRCGNANLGVEHQQQRSIGVDQGIHQLVLVEVARDVVVKVERPP